MDGTSYGVPWYVETRLIYYRTDLAEKAGVTPKPGWTQDDFKAFAKAMETKAGAKYGVSLAARRHRLMADVHAVRVAERRRAAEQ